MYYVYRKPQDTKVSLCLLEHGDAISNVYYKCTDIERACSKSINSDGVEHVGTEKKAQCERDWHGCID
jgi:hypothetical protein